MNYLNNQVHSCGKFAMHKILLTILSVLFLSSAFAQVEFLERSTVTNDGLYFWYPNEKKAYHYNPNISPRGDCFTVVNGYIFFGWYKGGMRNRNLMISRKRIGSGNWVTVQLPHKNTLIGPQKEWGDSHNTISVGVSKTDGTIHIFYDHHNDPLKYIVSKKDAAFVADGDFKIGLFNKTRGYLAEGQNITITYPKVTENDQGDLIVNYRKGSAVGGNEMVHVYDSKTSTWSRSRMVLRGSGLPQVQVEDRNYAYAPPPVLAGGNLYYGFSVRWARKKDDGVLNEGVYVAQCGPTMTSKWRNVKDEAYSIPVQDYSPFLIDLPATKNGAGSSGGPSLAVSDRGDIHMAFRSRGKNASDYYYTYVKKANSNEFEIINGVSKVGIAYGDRIYNTKIAKATGVITIESTEAGTFNYSTDLVYETGNVLGNSVVRIVDGKLVVVAEDRANKSTDSQPIRCYVFQLGEVEQEAQVDLSDGWYKIKNLETGRYLRSMGGNSIIAGSVSTGNDKQWQFIKSGDYYNIDSRTTADGSGILRAVQNDIIGTRRAAPRADVDKVWKLNEVASPTGAYRIELRDTGRYIYNETTDGNKLVQLSTKVGDRSKWFLEKVGTSSKIAGAKNNVKDASSVLVYPNPAKSTINIKLKGMNSAKVQIIDMLGKLVYSASTIGDDTLTLTKSNGLVSGLYLIQVTTSKGELFNEKLLVE